ncbi:MAG: hypothetical protein IPK97_19335 [Ahniella sp.]|nr:hypothetical protein [Ahniella sp.]
MLACGNEPAWSGEDWQIERSETAVVLPPEVVALIVDNPDGDIRLRRGETGHLGVRAVHQHPGPPAGAGWTGRTRGQVFRLNTHPASANDPRARVDIVITAPPDLRLTLRSVRGDIEVRRHAGPIKARTQGGDIAIQATGSVDASTHTGSIQAGLLGPAPANGARFRSRHGPIDLVVAAESSWWIDLRGCPIQGVADSARNTACVRLRQGEPGAPGLRARTGGALTLVRAPQH